MTETVRLNRRIIDELVELGIFDEIRALFQSENRSRLEELKVAIRTADDDRVGELLHTMRGSGLNVGADSLVETIGQAESAHASGEPIEFDVIERQFVLTFAGLDQYPSSLLL
jgi:HPt (histidine-containing phosphotransfer) domain-containing protein